MASITYTDELAGTLTATPAELLSARLDRLPMTRTLWIMASLVSLGGFFDALALELAATLAPGLYHDRILTATTVSFFGMTGLASFIAALFAGMLVGSLLFSQIADLFGRRTIFTFALLWYGVGSVMMAFQFTANGLNLWRFISTIGLGVELVTVDAYLSEIVPKASRGKAFGLLMGISAFSGVLSYFLAWQLVPIAPLGISGWRWVVLASSAGAVFVWWIRLGLPESPRWLAQQGRIDEAEFVMSRIEQRVEAEFGQKLPPMDRPRIQDPRSGTWSEIFQPPLRTRTIMLVMFNFFQTVGFYGFYAWIPTLLIAKGIHITQSLEYGLIIKAVGLLFPFIIMLFADRVERKWSVCLSCTAIAVFGLIFAQQTTPGALILLGICLGASTGYLSYALHNYQAELYPTRVRARAIGFVYSWSRLSGILVGFMVAFFLRNFGVPGVFMFVASCMAVVVISVAVLGPRTNNLELEAIAR